MKFLHISDLHYKLGFKNDANFKIYKTQLLVKLKEERENETFDFICFSGDLVNQGNKSEYEEFRSEFFMPLIEAVGVPQTACCFVPGNHDQDWEQLEFFSPEKLLNCKTNEEFNTLMSKQVFSESLLKSFSAYNDFVNSVNPPHEGRADLECNWTMDINNTLVKVNGLNSSLLAKFLNEDGFGKMRLSETQILNLLKPDENIDIQITMSHYPIDYLIPSEKVIFENQLMKTGGLYLHGHIHEMSHLKIMNNDPQNGSLLYCPVGPLFTKKEEEGRFSNSFNSEY
jgi:DNA repair exonuclease SbcCD nuclease subunit